MGLIYSEATRRFLNDLNKLSRIPHHESDAHLKRPSQLKGIRRLYEADTSKFEPIPQNREHLIKTLMPMVVKIAKSICSKYNSKIEYDDCISSGMQGAIIATDLYIEKSAIEPQPAKLSTYAHSYIIKYVNEYCYSTNSILSHGPTKWAHAGKEHVLSGNEINHTFQNSGEYFETSNDLNLMSHQNEDTILNQIDQRAISSKLFKNLQPFDKRVIFLFFGIGTTSATELKPNEIAKILKCSVQAVQESIDSSIEMMKLSKESISPLESASILRSTNLSQLPEWQLR